MANDFNGGFSGSLPVDEKGQSLPATAAKRVKLSNWNVQRDSALTPLGEAQYQTGHEVYYGYGGQPALQLFPGRESDWLKVNNLSEISIKARPNVTMTISYIYET